MVQTGYEYFSLYYDALTQNVDYPARAQYFDRLIRRYRETPVNTLLDLACGTGTMAEEMTRLGYDVLAIDYSPEMLSMAMTKKCTHNLPIQYVCQDMRHLELYAPVDVTLCTLDSLNHLPDIDAIKETFSSVAQYTTPYGLFLFDMNTLYKHRELLANNCYTYETDNVYLAWENTLLDDNATVDITLNIFAARDDGLYEREEAHITERAYPLDVIRDALKGANFTLLATYAADTDKPPSDTTDRVIFVAQYTP